MASGLLLLRFLDALLARDGLAWPLAGAGVGARALATHGQVAAMTEAAVAGNFFQARDVLLLLTPQLAFDDIFAVEDVGDAGDLFFGQVLRLALRVDASPCRTLPSAVVGPMPRI